MDGAALVEIMEGIGALDVDPVAKREFSNLVRGIGAAHGCVQIARVDRAMFARELLARKVSRATIRDRLIATFGVSRPEAYRTIGRALQLLQSVHQQRTQKLSLKPP
jgi:hypothetical protein